MDDRPIGQTPLGDPASSVLTMQTLEDVDVDAVCNGAQRWRHRDGPGWAQPRETSH